MLWYTEDWSRGILLGIHPDPNTGYRATIWFEYTRALFNEIREGSLVAIRNFRDRPESGNAIASTEAAAVQPRDRNFEEYSILQIDQVHPWHYAIQGPGEHATHWPVSPSGPDLSRHVYVKSSRKKIPAPGDLVLVYESETVTVDGKHPAYADRVVRGSRERIELPKGRGH